MVHNMENSEFMNEIRLELKCADFIKKPIVSLNPELRWKQMRKPVSESKREQNSSMTSFRMLKKSVPIWEKNLLTLEEASVYFNICANKLREMSSEKGCDFVLWNGTKRLIKRQKLEKYLEDEFSI